MALIRRTLFYFCSAPRLIHKRCAQVFLDNELLQNKREMEIGQKFNQLTVKEYFRYINNHKKYTDFNTLGLYRSIIENEKLSISDKIEIRDYAHNAFKKTFDFLQLKDPYTFVTVSTLGQSLTIADEKQIWSNVISNQEKILKDKKIKHRNFGQYAKHNCGHDDCPYNGLIIKQDSILMYSNMHFESDKNKYAARDKSDRRKAERKGERKLIDKIMNEE
jgi:hypothetical protein